MSFEEYRGAHEMNICQQHKDLSRKLDHADV